MLRLCVASVFALSLMAPQAFGSNKVNERRIADYDQTWAKEVIAAEGGYVVTANAADDGATDPVLVYKFSPRAEVVEWQTTLLEISSGQGKNIAETERGYLVAGRGQGSADDSSQLALLEKNSGRVLWKRWYEGEEMYDRITSSLPDHREGVWPPASTFHVNGVAASENSLFAIGYLTLHNRSDSEDDEKEVGGLSVLLQIDPANGGLAAEPVVFGQVGEWEVMYDVSATSQGLLLVGKKAVLAQGHDRPKFYNPDAFDWAPQVLHFDTADRTVTWTDEFRSGDGYFTKVRARDGQYFALGYYNDRTTVRSYDFDGVINWTYTSSDLGVANVTPTGQGGVYLVGRSGEFKNSFGTIVELSARGREIARTQTQAPTDYHKAWHTLRGAAPTPNGGFFAIGEWQYKDGGYYSQEDLWVVVLQPGGQGGNNRQEQNPAHPFNGQMNWSKEETQVREGSRYLLRKGSDGRWYAKNQSTGKVQVYQNRDWTALKG